MKINPQIAKLGNDTKYFRNAGPHNTHFALKLEKMKQEQVHTVFQEVC